MSLLNPAQNLLGKITKDGWEVIERKIPEPNSTGGNFSVTYTVKRGDDTAFLKAMDFSRIMGMPNSVIHLQNLTTAHNYECHLLSICKENRMNKVISILENGEILPDLLKGENFSVPYIVCELGEKSARDCLNIFMAFDNAWIMRSLHNIALGLKQLHNKDIAHQDLKPSNVVLFEKGKISKIADLGLRRNQSE